VTELATFKSPKLKNLQNSSFTLLVHLDRIKTLSQGRQLSLQLLAYIATQHNPLYVNINKRKSRSSETCLGPKFSLIKTKKLTKSPIIIQQPCSDRSSLSCLQQLSRYCPQLCGNFFFKYFFVPRPKTSSPYSAPPPRRTMTSSRSWNGRISTRTTRDPLQPIEGSTIQGRSLTPK
jgi:hypothetical protein